MNNIEFEIKESSHVKSIKFNKTKKNIGINRNFNFNYYDAGRTLCLLYMFEKKKVSIKDIEFGDGEVIVNNYGKIDNTSKNIQYEKVEDIAESIINSSVYRVGLIGDISVKSKENIEEIKDGFKDMYSFIIENKFSLGNNRLIGISKIKNSCYIDLKRQLHFIDVYFSKKDYSYERLSKINTMLQNFDENNEELTKEIDLLIDEAIFGYYNGKMEVAWIIERNGELVPIDYGKYGGNIEISNIFKKMSKHTNSKYYNSLSEQALNPLNRICKN